MAAGYPTDPMDGMYSPADDSIPQQGDIPPGWSRRCVWTISGSYGCAMGKPFSATVIGRGYGDLLSKQDAFRLLRPVEGLVTYMETKEDARLISFVRNVGKTFPGTNVEATSDIFEFQWSYGSKLLMMDFERGSASFNQLAGILRSDCATLVINVVPGSVRTRDGRSMDIEVCPSFKHMYCVDRTGVKLHLFYADVNDDSQVWLWQREWEPNKVRMGFYEDMENDRASETAADRPASFAFETRICKVVNFRDATPFVFGAIASRLHDRLPPLADEFRMADVVQAHEGDITIDDLAIVKRPFSVRQVRTASPGSRVAEVYLPPGSVVIGGQTPRIRPGDTTVPQPDARRGFFRVDISREADIAPGTKDADGKGGAVDIFVWGDGSTARVGTVSDYRRVLAGDPSEGGYRRASRIARVWLSDGDLPMPASAQDVVTVPTMAAAVLKVVPDTTSVRPSALAVQEIADSLSSLSMPSFTLSNLDLTLEKLSNEISTLVASTRFLAIVLSGEYSDGGVKCLGGETISMDHIKSAIEVGAAARTLKTGEKQYVWIICDCAGMMAPHIDVDVAVGDDVAVLLWCAGSAAGTASVDPATGLSPFAESVVSVLSGCDLSTTSFSEAWELVQTAFGEYSTTAAREATFLRFQGPSKPTKSSTSAYNEGLPVGFIVRRYRGSE